MLSIEQFEVTIDKRVGNPWDVMFLQDKNGNMRGGALDIIWDQWEHGVLSQDWGIQTIDITPPDGWEWYQSEQSVPVKVSATLKTIGFVVTLEGTAHRHELTDILDPNRSRVRIEGHFEPSSDNTNYDDSHGRGLVFRSI